IFNGILNGLGAGAKYATASGGTGITTTIYPHFTTRQVVKIEAQLHSAKLDEIAGPATEIIRDVNESPIAIASNVGSGRVIALADELLQDQVMVSGRDNRTFGNQTIEWLAGTSWVSPSAVAGRVPPDSSDSVLLTIDSSELAAGIHHLDVDVTHNIPGVAAPRVPIALTVTGHPEISASPLTVAFGSVVAGDSASKSIVVRNVGEEMLNMSSITISGPPFTTSATPFSLAPLDSAFITVSFAPLELGPAAASLFIASNDADDPVVAIALTGSGQMDCTQACAAPSLRAPTLTASDGFRFGLQILLEESEVPIDAFGFDLEFDPEIVSFADSSSTAALTSNFVVVSAEEIEPGRVRCAGFGSNAIPAGSSGALMRVFIEVNCPTCAIGDATDLVISNLIDDVAGMNACCGRLTIAECRHDGDVNVDGVLSSADALCAIQIYLNGGTVPPSCNVPGDCEAMAADVNCDDVVTPEDAHAIYDAAAAGEAPYPCFADGEVPSDAAHAAIDPLLRETVRGITAIEPNPTRGHVAIAYALGELGPAHLRIVDVAGREIRSLEKSVMPAGIYRALWDGREESGRESAAGIYFAVLEAGGEVSMRKVVLLR
ncbi:MAG TPA: choice-of-anchor D domain-containing protein, partial [bacterium]|nr:choice-of-anchor D domain-containing protein [bacterium]